jgi:hypothetical protein
MWPGQCEACDLDKITNTLTKSLSSLIKQIYLKQEKSNALLGMVLKLTVMLRMMSALYIGSFIGYTWQSNAFESAYLTDIINNHQFV